MMSKHSIQVCLNGCVINRNLYDYPDPNKKFCKDCGGKIFAGCPNCNKSISVDIDPMAYGISLLGLSPSTPPDFCQHCGEAFPWKGKRKERQLEAEKLGSSKEETKSLESEAEESIEAVKKVLSNFHLMAQKLLNRHAGRETLKITDEYDVQDLLRVLLTVDFGDVRPEEPTPSHAAKSAKMDFLLKEEKIAIEVKMIRERLTDKKVAEELIIDIARYKQHPDCDTLICFIYDPEGRIANPQGLSEDLQSQSKDDLKVIVFINPS